MWISELPLFLIRYLLLTIVVELLVAVIIGIRDKKDILNIALVNIVTNPLVNSIPIFFEYKYGMSARTIALYTLEVLTVLFEGFIYFKYLKNKKLNGFVLSLILNLSSYLIGVIINQFFYA